MMGIIWRSISKVDRFFTKHLFTANVITCGTLLGIGDSVVQGMGMYFQNTEEKKISYDFARTGRMIMMGFALGPFNHFWYKLLDKAVNKGSKATVVVKKIISDQMVAGPFFCTSFLIGMELLEGKGLEGAKQEWKDKFLQIYMVDWCFWPAAQMINFTFLPNKFRVVYVNVATLIWNSILSYLKHKKIEAEEEHVH